MVASRSPIAGLAAAGFVISALQDSVALMLWPSETAPGGVGAAACIPQKGCAARWCTRCCLCGPGDPLVSVAAVRPRQNVFRGQQNASTPFEEAQRERCGGRPFFMTLLFEVGKQTPGLRGQCRKGSHSA